ncbi:MAG: ABC transporter permease [Ilumatobacteraceae bacterium]
MLVDVGAVDAATIREVTQLPMVEVWGANAVVFAIVDGVDTDLAIIAPRDDRVGVDLERNRVLRGRMPNPTRADEMAVNESAADVTGVDVGDMISIETMTPQQVRDEQYFPALGPLLQVRIVGVLRGTDDITRASVDGGGFVASEAWLPTVSGDVDEWTTYLEVRLVRDASVADFETAVANLVPDGQEYEMVSFEERSNAARSTISTLATALAMFAIIAGAAAAVAVGQAISRHVGGVRSEAETLGNLGLTRVDRCVALVVCAIPVAVGGAALAVGVSWLASPIVPIGVARRADPDLGLFADRVALVTGAIMIIVVVVGSAAITATWVTRSRTKTWAEPEASKLADLVARAGGGPVLTNGARLALDRRSPGLPVRSAIAGVALALAGVFGALTFSSSLDRLSETPERWGYDWDLLLNFTSNDIDSAVEPIATDDRLTAVARWDVGFSFVDGVGVNAFGLAPVKDQIGYSLRSGRQPVNPVEVVLGTVTAERLGVGLGEQVEVTPSTGTSTSPAMVVVGTAIFPNSGDASFDDGIGFYGDAFAERAIVPDFFTASQLVVRVVPGLDIGTVAESLDAEYPGSASSAENRPFPPAEVANLTNIRAAPLWLAAFVILLGIASLLHVLLATVSRRRSELAVLRSIGLTARQTTACLVVQALTITGLGLIVGIPLGLMIGRAAWFTVAQPIGVDTDAAPPYATIGFAALVAVVITVLVAVGPGWSAARQHPAHFLRAE